jgi:hypothetical protein
MTTELSDLTNEELVELFDENYYTLDATGGEALMTILYETVDGSFSQHGLTDERMMSVLLDLAKQIHAKKLWEIVAYTGLPK